MSSELIKSFDFCYIYPLPKFPKEEKYIEEIKKVTLDLLNIFVKERIKELSLKITEKENKKEETEALRREYTDLLSILRQNS